MIGDLVIFTIQHPVYTGMILGACGFGGPIGIIGWCLGYESAMRKTAAWMRPRAKADDAHGDVPTLPPARERRFDHRGWMA